MCHFSIFLLSCEKGSFVQVDMQFLQTGKILKGMLKITDKAEIIYFVKKKIAKNVLYVKWTNVLFLQGEKKIENKKFFNTQQLATVQLIFVRKNCIINDCTRFADGKFESERAKKNLSSTFRELRRGKKRSGNARRDPFKNRELLN